MTSSTNNWVLIKIIKLVGDKKIWFNLFLFFNLSWCTTILGFDIENKSCYGEEIISTNLNTKICILIDYYYLANLLLSNLYNWLLNYFFSIIHFDCFWHIVNNTMLTCHKELRLLIFLVILMFSAYYFTVRLQILTNNLCYFCGKKETFHLI